MSISDKTAARQIIDALLEAGHTPVTIEYDGGDTLDVRDMSQGRIVEELTQTGLSYLIVAKGLQFAAILFVTGNGDPLDMVADWHESLSPVIEPVMDGWK
jgi:hypothetical protein